jgi:hypothetical protein
MVFSFEDEFRSVIVEDNSQLKRYMASAMCDEDYYYLFLTFFSPPQLWRSVLTFSFAEFIVRSRTGLFIIGFQKVGFRRNLGWINFQMLLGMVPINWVDGIPDSLINSKFF